MALTRVQATSTVTSNGPTAIVIPFSTPPTVGNGLIVVVGGWSNGTSPTFTVGGCTDNRGNAYLQAEVRNNGNVTAAIYFCPKVVTAGASFAITVYFYTTTPPATMYYTAQAFEVSGIGTSLTNAITSGSTGTSTTPATGTTGASPCANLYAVAYHLIASTQTTITVAAVSPTWNQEHDVDNSVVASEADYRNLTSFSGSTTSCSWTDTTSAAWAAVIVGFASSDDLSLATGRVTQDAIELLELPVPDARVTQYSVELISSTAAVGIVTQYAVEVLTESPIISSAEISYAYFDFLVE